MRRERQQATKKMPESKLTSEIGKAILGMHNQGLSSRQIESIIGTMDHSTICEHLKTLTPTKTSEIYKELRADILAERQVKLLIQSDKAIENARDQRDYATAYGIYYDKERLERGQSTENIGYLDYNRAFEQIRAERLRLAQELGIDDAGAVDNSQDNPVDNCQSGDSVIDTST